jgi:cytochrome P450
MRITTRETSLGGVNLPKGTWLLLKFAAANRDPKRFKNPDQIDLARTDSVPHLAYSGGIHNCVGQALARKELNLGLSALLKRTNDLQLTPGKETIRYRHFTNVRLLESLHVSFSKA